MDDATESTGKQVEPLAQRDDPERALRVYIAGPLGARDDWRENTAAACRAADDVMRLSLKLRRRVVPFVPHLATEWARRTERGSSRSYQAWITWCLQWVDACDVVYRLPGASPGADQETERARRQGKPVVRSLRALRDAVRRMA